MKQRFNEKERQYFVNRYLKGESVLKICKETNISRSTIYDWIKEHNCKNSNDLPATQEHKLNSEIKNLEEKINILSEINCNAKAPLRERLNEMERLYEKYPVRILCETLSINKGTFYNHLLHAKKDNTLLSKRDKEMTVIIKQIFDDSRQTYGAKKIEAKLKENGYKVSDKYVRKIMKEQSLFTVRTTAKKDYAFLNTRPKIDRVKMNFNTTRPDEIWVSDTTTFKYKDKYYYICAIVDLYSRKVLSYKIGLRHTSNLINRTFNDAIKDRDLKDLTFHSDRGVQYTSESFEKLLSKYDIKRSFSPSGSPQHNAVMESFFSTLKKEELYRMNYHSEKELKAFIAKFISFYNNERPHAYLKFTTPNAYENLYFQRQKK